MKLLVDHPNAVGKPADTVKPGDVLLLELIVTEVNITSEEVRFTMQGEESKFYADIGDSVVVNEPESEFKVGDRVRYDDSDVMTVEEIHGTTIRCSWRSGADGWGTWTASCLTLVEPEEYVKGTQ